MNWERTLKLLELLGREGILFVRSLNQIRNKNFIFHDSLLISSPSIILTSYWGRLFIDYSLHPGLLMHTTLFDSRNNTSVGFLLVCVCFKFLLCKWESSSKLREVKKFTQGHQLEMVWLWLELKPSDSVTPPCLWFHNGQVFPSHVTKTHMGRFIQVPPFLRWKDSVFPSCGRAWLKT